MTSPAAEAPPSIHMVKRFTADEVAASLRASDAQISTRCRNCWHRLIASYRRRLLAASMAGILVAGLGANWSGRSRRSRQQSQRL